VHVCVCVNVGLGNVCACLCMRECRAWEQMEVTCTRNIRRGNVLWNVEQITDSRRKWASLQLCVFYYSLRIDL